MNVVCFSWIKVALGKPYCFVRPISHEATHGTAQVRVETCTVDDARMYAEEGSSSFSWLEII